MADFSQQIANFTTFGTYPYIFDDVGNEILNASSSMFQQVYFSLPLGNYVLDSSKVLSFYDPTFTEFVPAAQTTGSMTTFPQAANDQINNLTFQNTQLQSQLNSVIASSAMNSGSADNQSIKNIITSLRIQLGQGSIISDFDENFPYFPLTLEQKNAPSQ